jgi:uncharacterized membrane protein YbhN (UPF0104 family)
VSRQGKRWWQVLLQPRIFLPLLLSAALLAFAFSISNLDKVFGRIDDISFATIAAAFLLALIYLSMKCLEFNLLLRRLGIRLHWRRLVFAFAVAEMTITIPAGVYVQNYILQRMRSAGFARSAAATTGMLLIELCIILLVLALLGIPHWEWARPVAITVLAGLVLLLGLVISTDLLAARLLPRVKHSALRVVVRGLAEVTEGLEQLATLRTAVPAVLLAVAYLAALAAAFTLVGRGTGVADFTYLQAATVYAFSLTVTLLMAGILTQLGVIEVAGLGAAATFGYGPSEALAMMLGFRIVWMGSIWLICGPTALMLRDVLRTEPAPDGQSVES